MFKFSFAVRRSPSKQRESPTMSAIPNKPILQFTTMMSLEERTQRALRISDQQSLELAAARAAELRLQQEKNDAVLQEIAQLENEIDDSASVKKRA